MTHMKNSRSTLYLINIGAFAVFIMAPLASTPSLLANDAIHISSSAQAEAQKLAAEPPRAPPDNRIVDDHSGRKESGTASIYAHDFDGKTMADGKRYEPQNNVAASKNLPLGTVARVTNLQTGKSIDVKIEDRGPFKDRRVVDLAPHAAHAIGLSTKEGLAPVIVSPITVPQPDGSLKFGAGAATPAAALATANIP